MKRSEMIKMMIAVLEEVGNVPNDIKAKSILAAQIEAGILPPKAVLKNGKIETTDYFFENEDTPEDPLKEKEWWQKNEEN